MMSRHRILWVISLLVITIFLFPNLSFSAQERRLALLIGNSNYTHGGGLPNPVNDVRAMEKALESLGFTVMKHENCTQREMRMAMDEFGRLLKGQDVGLFFYAGHGVQILNDTLKHVGEQFGIEKYSAVSSIVERVKNETEAEKGLKNRMQNLAEKITKSQRQTPSLQESILTSARFPGLGCSLH